MYNKEECKGERIVAKVLPFQAVRPAVKYANEVAALPYDVYDRQEAKAAVEGKPLSFLNIIVSPVTFIFYSPSSLFGNSPFFKQSSKIFNLGKYSSFINFSS